MLRCITGKLKPRRFEPSRSTGSKVFFLLTRLDANNCIYLAKCLYSFRDDLPDWTKALPKNSRSPFPVDMRRSKTSFICFHYYLKNSGPVNFVPKSRLPIVQVIFIYRKTTAKARNCYQRWLCRNETRISI